MLEYKRFVGPSMTKVGVTKMFLKKIYLFNTDIDKNVWVLSRCNLGLMKIVKFSDWYIIDHYLKRCKKRYFLIRLKPLVPVDLLECRQLEFFLN